jgi:hypothetical protein
MIVAPRAAPIVGNECGTGGCGDRRKGLSPSSSGAAMYWSVDVLVRRRRRDRGVARRLMSWPMTADQNSQTLLRGGAIVAGDTSALVRERLDHGV